MENDKWKLKLTLLLVSSLTIMSVITISPALPEMTLAFADVQNASLLVKLVLTVPALMIAVFAPVTGQLIDRYGRLKMLWWSLLLYAISGAGGYFLDNLYHIVVSRALLGISVGMSMTIVITLIADYFQGHERQRFVGIQIAFMSMGGIVFIGSGGVLADFGWRFPFLMYLFSLLVLPLSMMVLHEPVITQRTDPVAPHVKAPAIIWMLFINTMIMWIIFFLIPVQIPFYLKAIGIEKNSMIGAAIAMSTAFSSVSAFLYSRIKGRLNFLSIFAVGYLFMGAGFICISVSDSYPWIILAMMLSGFGMGMMIPNTNMWVMQITPPEIRGKEIGKLTTFWFFGQFISPIIIFPVVSNITLSATFLLAAGFLMMMSLLSLIFHVIKAGKYAMR